ncbi:aminotransferase class IV family protein [Streptomyces aidingensis]|uniref:Branched-chain amino acid aminotransferase/4-amino-4-deoxychorismate lyase n=1 Tax=Streptomyces aidingensis TaxID=910347 RepID=A0A1I1RJ28_9ACTN|nr:aminotransferase class IV family protein [Streptomyces aidingensis]SFD34286.1 Branched-chain amino acid aminotransferase/4-amino-4-deoxychorismate lyase [Streptomyces aidingensis]
MPSLDGPSFTSDDMAALALTNLGHFTSIRVDGGRVRGLSLHLTRLARDCRTVFDAELDINRVHEQMCRAAHRREGAFVLRVTVFDPAITLGTTGADAHPAALVTVRPAGSLDQPPLRVASHVFQRELPQVKHTGLFASLYHRRAAMRAGADDVLFTDTSGAVSEGATWNIGFWDGRRVVWPKAEVLPGVTMALLQEQADHTTAPVTLSLDGMEAAFAANTSIGVRPISMIDDTALPSGHPALQQLRNAYLTIPGEPLE